MIPTPTADAYHVTLPNDRRLRIEGGDNGRIVVEVRSPAGDDWLSTPDVCRFVGGRAADTTPGIVDALLELLNWGGHLLAQANAQNLQLSAISKGLLRRLEAKA